MLLENNTPFEAERYGICDENGEDLLLMVIKGTYEFDENGNLTIAEKQEQIEMADQYHDEPDNSSLKYASDFSFGKPATDIALIGHAYAPNGKTRESLVVLHVGSIQKVVKVFGDRHWKKNVGVSRVSKPEPFEKMPLIYERAFGGVDKSNQDPKRHEFEPRNPIGVGFRAKKSKLPIDETNLPNLEDPKNLIKSPGDRPDPVGFGFISPAWQPRAGFAGTYGEGWREKRMPLLPVDFDKRFFNAANPDLIYQGFLQGNEQIVVAGVSPSGAIRFSLPGVLPICGIEIKESEEQQIEINLVKLVIDTDENHLILVWSGSLIIPGEFQDIETIKCELKD
jgi:hypothetical protein